MFNTLFHLVLIFFIVLVFYNNPTHKQLILLDGILSQRVSVLYINRNLRQDLHK